MLVTKKLPLACELPTGRAEVIVPTGAESWQGLPISNVNGDMFMATVRKREEKGSNVNVATHLLFLPMSSAGRSRTAIVISNDSDIAVPLSIARSIVPVGTVNPGIKQLAGALKGDRNEGPRQSLVAKALRPGLLRPSNAEPGGGAFLPACRLAVV
jgi:hypothetical protein